MKKSRIFMTTGALILAISAIFATKANKKFTYSFKTGCYALSHTFHLHTSNKNPWLTASNTGNPAFVTIRTSAGHFANRFQLCTCVMFTKLLYYW
jgi:hypothetical protein